METTITKEQLKRAADNIIKNNGIGFNQIPDKVKMHIENAISSMEQGFEPESDAKALMLCQIAKESLDESKYDDFILIMKEAFSSHSLISQGFFEFYIVNKDIKQSFLNYAERIGAASKDETSDNDFGKEIEFIHTIFTGYEVVSHTKKNYEEALVFSEAHLSFTPGNINAIKIQKFALNKLANYHAENNDYLKAAQYAQKAVDIVEDGGEKQNIKEFLSSIYIAHLNVFLKDRERLFSPQERIEFCDAAIKLYQLKKDEESQKALMRTIAELPNCIFYQEGKSQLIFTIEHCKKFAFMDDSFIDSYNCISFLFIGFFAKNQTQFEIARKFIKEEKMKDQGQKVITKNLLHILHQLLIIKDEEVLDNGYNLFKIFSEICPEDLELDKVLLPSLHMTALYAISKNDSDMVNFANKYARKIHNEYKSGTFSINEDTQFIISQLIQTLMFEEDYKNNNDIILDLLKAINSFSSLTEEFKKTIDIYFGDCILEGFESNKLTSDTVKEKIKIKQDVEKILGNCTFLDQAIKAILEKGSIDYDSYYKSGEYDKAGHLAATLLAQSTLENTSHLVGESDEASGDPLE